MVYSGGYAPNGNALTTSQAQSFIPELWMREIKRYLQDNLVMSRYTRNVPFGGQAGDTIRMPELDRLGVNAKLPGTPVSFQSRKETGVPGSLALTPKRSSSGMRIVSPACPPNGTLRV